MNRIRVILKSQLNIVDLYAWSDSAIVLFWVTNSHTAYKTYISNRGHQILVLLSLTVDSITSGPTKTPPTALRGAFYRQSSLSLYWQGPQFIHDDLANWDETVPSIIIQDLSETWPVALMISIEHAPEWFERFSSYDQLVRVTAHMYRFINVYKKNPHKMVATLQRQEIDDSVWALVIASQQCHFASLSHESSASHVSSKHLITSITLDYVRS